MITYFIVGIIALFFSYLSKCYKNDIGLLVSFILIFFFLAFRFNYGNDYSHYNHLFYDINANFVAYLKGDYRVEFGWVILNKIFYPFGFFTMIFSLALFYCIVYYNFIKKFVKSENYWFAIIIFYFNSNYLLVQLSAMRQTLAIILFIYSLNYIINKKYLKSILFIFLAFSFHNSAVIIYPIVLISLFLNFKINIVKIVIIEIVFISFFVIGELLKSQLIDFMSFIFENRYLNYLDWEIEKPSLINIFVYSTLLIIVLKFYNRMDFKFKILNKLFVFGILFLPLGFIIPISGRMAYYFLPLSIVIYPKIFELIKSKLIKNVFVLSVIIVLIIRLYTFFNSDIYGPYFSEYSSIFKILL